MELNWTTFALEVVNFLILVWILKRFLYKPVLEAIVRRKAAIDKTLSDARALQDQATALEQQYRNRVADWETEKETMRAGIREEIAAQREKLMAALQKSLADEREKARAVEQRRLDDLVAKADEDGKQKGAQFAASLLSRFASPDLEARIAEVTLEELPLLPPEQLAALVAAVGKDSHSIAVTSAFPLPPARRATLEAKLREIVPGPVSVIFQEDTRLVAGLRLAVGPWVVDANIAGELRFFTGALRHNPSGQS